MAYIDPELEPALRALPPLVLDVTTLHEVRVERSAMYAQAPALILKAVVETFVVPGVVPGVDPAPPIRVVSYRPANIDVPLTAILHVHGGGYVLGSPEMMDAANHGLAIALGCRVVSVDYRLAPETAFPGALDDCYTVLSWLCREAGALGVDASRIGVKGESAGGGLAAALALLARDRGGPHLAFQHLIYPMLDDRTGSGRTGSGRTGSGRTGSGRTGSGADPHPHTGHCAWTPENNRFGWASYLGRAPGGAEESAYAAPARAADLANLPPTFIAVGGLDLFLDENIHYAHRLSRAGVPVELHVYPGAFHGFQRAGEAAVARAANRDSLDALRRSFASAT